MSLRLRGISARLGDFTLEIESEMGGRITAIFGPSGAGKTTLLDIVAGLRRPERGFIQLNDRVLNDAQQKLFVAPNRRKIGYVPQDLALFPHLSVRKNLEYGQDERSNEVFSFGHVTKVLEIEALVDRNVKDLSGGEKQRVALARALLTCPQLLLLDEPLASLDIKLKLRIIPYLQRIRDEFRIPMLYVTHDRYETLALADEMVVMVGGKVAQSGSVQEVFSKPGQLSVAALLSVETIQQGFIKRVENGLASVALGSITLTAVPQQDWKEETEVHVCIRAEDVILQKGGDNPSSARNHLPGVVQGIIREGALARVELDCGFPLSALLTKQACEEMRLNTGDRVYALIKAPNIHLIGR